MDRASDYNVSGSLLGLGENILLELLSQMEHPQDVQQFLILSKKTFKLILHPRYARVIQSIIQITQIFIIKESKQGIAEGNKFFHSDKNECCTIAIDPIISDGIVRIEIILENNGEFAYCMGIADASCSFAAGKKPWDDGNREMTIRYYWDGEISHITWGPQNQEYSDGQKVGIEVDMTTVPRRVTFFVDDIEQPYYVIGIPSEIRFWAYISNKSSSFTVTKFERLIKSSAKGVEGSKALEWGKKW
ncbi:MAG: hypothetical protein EZS28_039367 [Streblomastix strix]|uniref:SPRY domain-containing protein n=1 Tax=Streblomastix strix TaxID=222440 RepID=A0A5J4U2U3_9EUKA|nr:MAG: hypothetical protein EZS28_039367 [Streblomastix strix]